MVNPGVDGYAVVKPQINGKYSEKCKKNDTVLNN